MPLIDLPVDVSIIFLACDNQSYDTVDLLLECRVAGRHKRITGAFEPLVHITVGSQPAGGSPRLRTLCRLLEGRWFLTNRRGLKPRGDRALQTKHQAGKIAVDSLPQIAIDFSFTEGHRPAPGIFQRPIGSDIGSIIRRIWHYLYSVSNSLVKSEPMLP